MKLRDFFSSASDAKLRNMDYLYLNCLFGSWAPLQNKFEKAFNDTSLFSTPYRGIEFVDKILDVNDRAYFLDQNKNDFTEITIKEDEVSFPFGFTLYAYDHIGKPPFKITSEFEDIHTFGMFGRCKTFTTFEGAETWMPKNVWQLQFSETGLRSLRGIEKVFTSLNEVYFSKNHDLKSHVLGLMMIEGITAIDFADEPKVEAILRKYLPDHRLAEATYKDQIFEIQEDLIDAGFEQLAQI